MKQFAILAAIAALASCAAADFVGNSTHFHDPDTNQITRKFGCDVHRGKASPHYLKTIEKLYKGHKSSKAGSRAPRAVIKKQTTQTPIAVNMYFHILSTTANANLVTEAMVTAQEAEMNKAYNPYGISFTLVNTSYTTNDDWSVGAGDDLMAAHSALRVGTYQDLNIYFHTDLAGGNLGTCTLPSQVYQGAAPSVYSSDGCDVNANTMPNGAMTGYNLGKTAVHETGHWLGLLHPFEGYSCTGPGDSVADTPQESVSTDGCPKKPAKNSCPTVAGNDPIHNYMDYSTDACYTKFSPDQVARMDRLWTEYRAGM